MNRNRAMQEGLINTENKRSFTVKKDENLERYIDNYIEYLKNQKKEESFTGK